MHNKQELWIIWFSYAFLPLPFQSFFSGRNVYVHCNELLILKSKDAAWNGDKTSPSTHISQWQYPLGGFAHYPKVCNRQ